MMCVKRGKGLNLHLRCFLAGPAPMRRELIETARAQFTVQSALTWDDKTHYSCPSSVPLFITE